MNFLNATLAVLALLSLVLAFWQWLAARRFPLHRRDAGSFFFARHHPAQTAQRLRCHRRRIARKLVQPQLLRARRKFSPASPMQMIRLAPPSANSSKKIPAATRNWSSAPNLTGANGKVSTLIQLERLARHPLMLVSDGDVRVPPDFLANVVAPLRDEGGAGSPLPAETTQFHDGAHGVTRPTPVGLVNCFYRLANPTTTAMRWEAVAINADFWEPGAAGRQPPAAGFRAWRGDAGPARSAPAKSAVLPRWPTASRTTTSSAIALPNRGHRIALCPVVVECWEAPMNWRDVWRRQLRWARTIRVCRPLPYFFSILANAALWPLLWLVAALVSATPLYAAFTAAACLLIRICLAQNLQRRLMPERGPVSPWWFVPVKDLLQAALWLGAFTGNTVEWRGQKMRLRRDGTLVA